VPEASTWTRTARLVTYAAAASVATAIAWFAFGLSSVDWRIPLQYHGDALAVASHFKTVLETGWYEYQPALGAPFGQVYFDYPVSDNLHFMVAKVLGLFSTNVGVVLNLYFLLGFPLAAIAMVWLLDRLGVSAPIAGAIAVVFAIAPYHFWRGEGHLFLAAYFVVPPAIWLVYSTARGWPVFARRSSGSALARWATLPTLGVILTMALLGTASSYYSLFTLLLLATAGVAAAFARHWRAFWHAVVAGLILVVVVLANMAPDILYRLQHGANAEAMLRTPVETEIYSFKLAQLLLPAPGHQFGPFRELRALYDQHYPLSSEGPALGLIGAVGFVALVVVLCATIARTAAATRVGEPSPLLRALSALGLLALVAFLFGTVGGLSTFVSFVTTSVRAWNRLSILILVLALAAVALLVDRMLAAWRRRTMPSALPAKLAAGLVAVLLVALATWDQVPVMDTQVRAQEAAQFASDASLVDELEEQLPHGSAVLQLPYIPFPESEPVNGVLDTEQLRFFLHSSTLRWSSGGIKGRPDMAEIGDVAALEPPTLVAQAEALGYAAIMLDEKALGPEASSTLEAALTTELGAPLRSDDRRVVVYVF
jgi:phosphoglycerol transferase